MQQIFKNENKETRVTANILNEKQNIKQAKENKIKIPKLPSLKEFLTNYNKNEKQNTLNHIFEENIKQSIDNLLKGENKKTWQQGLSNALGRLANGYEKIKGTNTIAFIHKQDIPNNKKVTYPNMVCDYRPLKSKKYRVRLTVGGDKLTCEFDVASPAASILETKLVISSVI